MSDRFDLTDDLIERGLLRRAPRGTDARLLDRVMADVASTSQVIGWWPRPLAGLGRSWRKPASLLVVAGVSLAVVGAMLGGSGGDRTKPAVIVASPSPSSEPSPSPIGSDGPCTTDTIVVRVGEEMPPLTTAPPIAPAPGVFTIASPIGSTHTEVWVAEAGAVPTRIATVDGPGINVVDLPARSPDGSLVLLGAGKVSPAGLNPECSDLYLIRTDGSEATRLTYHGPGEYVTAAAFSPDGRTIAYSSWDGVSILDIETGESRLVRGCDSSYAYTGSIAWAPSGVRFAIVCNDQVVVVDPVEARATRTATGAGNVLAIGWSGDTVVAARIGGLEPAAHVRIERIDPASERVEVGDALADEGIEWVIVGNDSISPDGTHAIIEGGLVGSAPGIDFQSGFYLIDVAGGPPRLVLQPLEAFDGWTKDGQAILAVDYNAASPTLIRIDRSNDARSTLGPLPAGLSSVIWAVP